MMKKRSMLVSAVILLTVLAACSPNAPAPTQLSDAELVGTIVAATLAAQPSPTATLNPNATPEATLTPTPTATPTPEPTLTGITKSLTILDRYVIKVPEEFTAQEILSSPATSVPMVRITAPNGQSFDIFVQPYAVSAELVPGKCVVSTEFDAGNNVGSAFCEGLTLTGLLSFPGWTVKYGSVVTDLTLSCTANSPCPVDMPPGSRYSIMYTFVLPDKAGGKILEFYVGDAFRGPSDQIDGFQGLSAVISDLVIPSLTIRKP